MFLCTSDFVNSLKKLQKKPKAGYSSCKEDIRYVLGERSFDEIWELRDQIKDYTPSKRLIKLRVPNSGQNLSKRDGFRLFMLLDKDKELITFLYVYPKRGKYARTNITDQERENLAKTYFEEFKNNSLKKFKDFF